MTEDYKDPKDELAELGQEMGLYKDPLHIPSAQLVVMHNGKEALVLNKALMDQQNCWGNLEHIKWLHAVRLRLEDKIVEIAVTDLPTEEFNILLGQWEALQFELQKAWGFPRNAKFHRFWDMKGCTCPKMDNNDRYPSGIYITAGDCPIHGREITKMESRTSTLVLTYDDMVYLKDLLEQEMKASIDSEQYHRLATEARITQKVDEAIQEGEEDDDE